MNDDRATTSLGWFLPFVPALGIAFGFALWAVCTYA